MDRFWIQIKKSIIAILLAGVCFGVSDFEIGGDLILTGDEKKLWFYEGTNYLTFRAPSALASNYNFIWPTDDGTGGQALITDGSGTLSWTEPSTSFTHELLSPTHTDSTTGTVVRGDLIIGQGATPKWARKALGASGTILRSDGTDALWAATTSITALGTIATGVWQATDIGVQYGGTGASTLNDLITLTTHTTGNYVASVATTAPLSGGAGGSEGATLTLSIPVAATDANGYLCQTDWDTFNGKQTQGDVLDDLNTLGANPFSGDPAPDFLVGTSAGGLAWQSGATARTSLGLGTGDGPTFDGITIAGTPDYTFEVDSNSLTIKAGTTGVISYFGLFGYDNPAEEDVGFCAWGVGAPADIITDSERLWLGYNIHAVPPTCDIVSQAFGAGTVRQLRIYTGANITQCVLNIDGTITFGYALTCDDLTISSPSNIYALSHDNFADFEPNEHIDWKEATDAFLTTNTGSFGEGLIVNNNETNLVHLTLKGKGRTSTARGGSVEWGLEEAGGVAGYTFGGYASRFTWSGSPQGSFDDAGLAWVSMYDGSAMFADGAFNINEVGSITNVHSIISDGDITTTAEVGIGTSATPARNLEVVTTLAGQGIGIRRNSGTENVFTGLYLKTSTDTSSSYFKGGILFQDTGETGARGKLHICVDRVNDSGSIAPADAKITIQDDVKILVNTDITGTINTTSDDNWDLNDYTADADHVAAGYVTVTINGTSYRLLAYPTP